MATLAGIVDGFIGRQNDQHHFGFIPMIQDAKVGAMVSINQTKLKKVHSQGHSNLLAIKSTRNGLFASKICLSTVP